VHVNEFPLRLNAKPNPGGALAFLSNQQGRRQTACPFLTKHLNTRLKV
jgi:hypothetical protein